MKKKRILAGFLAAVLASMALTGCAKAAIPGRTAKIITQPLKMNRLPSLSLTRTQAVKLLMM